MKLLAFDTATTGCSAALLADGRIVARRAAAMTRGQSEALMPMIEDVLAEAGAGYADLSALAVTVGPGAFTGLRIGLAAARGLALALRIPLAGVTTLEAVAASVPDDARRGRRLLVALDSKRDDLYAQAFGPDLSALSGPAALFPEALADLAAGGGPLLVAGDAAGRAVAALKDRGIPAEASDAPGVPDAAIVARIAADRPLPPAGSPPSPVYLRPPDAVAAKNGGRLRP